MWRPAAREALLKKLKLYRLRAKVEIELRPQLGVYAGLKGHPGNRPALTPIAPSALPIRGWRRWASAASARRPRCRPICRARSAIMPRGWSWACRKAGDFGFEKIFALDAGLDELHAVSFDKGCYIGQELTSRMKHRATARKRILTVTADAPLPAPGTR